MKIPAELREWLADHGIPPDREVLRILPHMAKGENSCTVVCRAFDRDGKTWTDPETGELAEHVYAFSLKRPYPKLP